MHLWFLQRDGWHYEKETVIHTLQNIARNVCDGREPIRHKLYYMVLCKLAKHLQRTSAIPSDQSQLFYRLLLAGKQVEPGLPLETYLELSGGKRKLLALPAPEPGLDGDPLPLPEPIDEDIVVAVMPELKKAKRPRAKASAMPMPKAAGEPPAGPVALPLPPVPPVPPTDGPPSDGGGCPGPGPGGGGAPPSPEGDPPPVEGDPDDDIVVARLPPEAQPEAATRGRKRELPKHDALGGDGSVSTSTETRQQASCMQIPRSVV